MAVISLKWFGGMIPRAGEQHLPPPHATEAENCNLYSGELRPLNKPALAHRFWSPTEFDIFPPIIGPPCLIYDCSSYKDAILDIYGPQLAFYFPLQENYDAGVAIDSSPLSYDGSRNATRSALRTDADQIPIMDICDQAVTYVAGFTRDSGGNTSVGSYASSPADNRYVGYGDNHTSSWLMNSVTDVNSGVGVFYSIRFTGNGVPLAGYIIQLVQHDPPIFQYAFNPSDQPTRIRFTSPEMAFSFIDKPWWIITFHIVRTETSCYIKMWADDQVVWDQLYLSSEEGLTPLLADNPIWEIDYEYPSPVDRGIVIGYSAWGQGGPTPFTGSDYFSISGEATDAQVSALYEAYQQNSQDYVDPDPNCVAPLP
jgi:hypothetical protein